MKTSRIVLALLALLPGLAFAQGTLPGGSTCKNVSASCQAKHFLVSTGGDILPSSDLNGNIGSASKRFIGIFAAALKDGSGNGRLIWNTGSTIYTSAVADGASAVGHIFNSVNTLSTAGALIATFAPDGSHPKFSIDKDGKLLGTFATPQLIDLSYGGNGIRILTGSAVGGDFVVGDVNGTFFFHASSGGLTQGSVENPIPVVHQAQTGNPVAMEFGTGTASAGGALTVTFATAFGTAPSCVCTDENAVPVACGITAKSTTSVSFAITARADVLDWHCTGGK